MVPVRDYDVPLCEDHVLRLKDQLALGRDGEQLADLLRSARRGGELTEDEQAKLADALASGAAADTRRNATRSRAEREALSQVYFMRHDRIIKIGHSIDPRKRAQNLSGAVILAMEPGTRVHEEALHAKFCHLRLRGEWFTPGPELIAYINKLRKKAGAKPITADGEVAARAA